MWFNNKYDFHNRCYKSVILSIKVIQCFSGNVQLNAILITTSSLSLVHFWGVFLVVWWVNGTQLQCCTGNVTRWQRRLTKFKLNEQQGSNVSFRRILGTNYNFVGDQNHVTSYTQSITQLVYEQDSALLHRRGYRYLPVQLSIASLLQWSLVPMWST